MSLFKAKIIRFSYNKSNITNLDKENFDKFNINIFSDKTEPEIYKLNISPKQNMLSIKQKAIEFVQEFW